MLKKLVIVLGILPIATSPALAWGKHGGGTGGGGGGGGGGSTTCPKGTADSLDGCSNANINASFSNASFFTNARQSGQGAYSGLPSYNVAGVDYPVGWDTTKGYTDAPSISMPSGCSYQPTGNTNGSPRIFCSGAVSPTFRYVNFCVAGAAVMVRLSGGSGTATFDNDKFCMDSGQDFDNNALIQFAVGTHYNIVFTNNECNGTGAVNSVICISNNSVGVAGGGANDVTFDFKYNYIHDIPTIPMSGKGSYACNTLAYNYIANMNTNFNGTTHNTHGAFYALTQDANTPTRCHKYFNNTWLAPSTSPAGNGTVPFSILSGGGGHNTFDLVDVEDNDTIINKAATHGCSDGTDCNYQSAITEPLHTAGITTFTSKNNHTDPTGTYGCFASAGDSSGNTGSVAANATNSTVTITVLHSGAIYEGAAFGKGPGAGDLQSFTGSISGTTLTVTSGSITLATGAPLWGLSFDPATRVTVGGTGTSFTITPSQGPTATQKVYVVGRIQPYGTVDPNTGLASTGTGGTGTYVLSGVQTIASNSSMMTFNMAVTTFTESGDIDLLDGSAATIDGVQWNDGTCFGHI